MVSRIAAAIVVLSLLSTAVSAVRSAMQERRERAEDAWNAARICVLTAMADGAGRGAGLRQCSAAARSAADSSLELPEHGSRQMEARAALDELARALESGDEQHLSSVLDSATRACSALGWRVVPAHSP